MHAEGIRTVVGRCVGAALLALAGVAGAATIEVINIDDPGIGFNDPTPAQAVGGNSGATVGEQRQIVFAKVAQIWGARLQSPVTIRVLASFGPLECTATDGALGGAGPLNIALNFPSAPRMNTWYPLALANKLAGIPVVNSANPLASADIGATFNGNLGKPGCLDGGSFYLGLDGKNDARQFDLLSVALHEFGHGLGFLTFTDELTGAQVPAGPGSAVSYPSIWDHFLFDPQQRKTWAEMTDAERVTSAITPRNLVWDGDNVTRALPRVLSRGVAELYLHGRGLNRFVVVGDAEFGPRLGPFDFLAQPVVAVKDQAGSTQACAALDAASAAAVRGKIALVDAGTCASQSKIKNAQNAGARAVVVADTRPGSPPQPLVGSALDITIASVRISQEDGNALRASIAAATPNKQPIAALFENPTRLAGADLRNRIYMFTPNPVQQGSSVSHYDTSARRNLLMEPRLNDGLTTELQAPNDLTYELFLDIGW